MSSFLQPYISTLLNRLYNDPIPMHNKHLNVAIDPEYQLYHIWWTYPDCRIVVFIDFRQPRSMINIKFTSNGDQPKPQELVWHDGHSDEYMNAVIDYLLTFSTADLSSVNLLFEPPKETK